MSSTVSTTVGNIVVVTHVHNANANANANTGENTQKLVDVQRFIGVRPQTLGMVEIIIGLVILIFGVAMTPNADTISTISGFFIWGAAFYVTAGSLTVAAARRPSRCLVNCAKAFSIVAVVTAFIAVILYTLDTAGILLYCNYYIKDNYYCYRYKSRVQGVSGVLLIFNLLQLIVSFIVIDYNRKVTCCCAETPSVIVVPAESVVTGQTAAPYTGEETPLLSDEARLMHNFKGEASAMIPPAYDDVVD